MKTQAIFSHKSDDWRTPKKMYDLLNREFKFDYDPCPLQSKKKNAMFKDWKGRIFINPPYSNIQNFIEKGLLELKKKNAKLLVYLLPARTDSKWFHDFIIGKAEIRFIRKRLYFSNYKGPAPFPSMIIIFRR